ncbi:hypothetical protein T4B_3082 [Trichinella pseudospiralis]|uniref:Uncharacterized protein n=1 Tax=Trichinella pseudospiralis TaxID=6337 RepID=A0A0V1K6P9_TRIPS|nr:hypothetical protein T4A_13026 [Trichinella pseudospiralis]KRZ29309.1 hypothetical protein T4B_3082 [Trichinella pseudospiralis]KRZ42533.1 hypothetical protein T4C_2353 [Trichinella pseudospiralis]
MTVFVALQKRCSFETVSPGNLQLKLIDREQMCSVGIPIAQKDKSAITAPPGRMKNTGCMVSLENFCQPIKF